ncbi:hypothetical protein Taro_036673 [Colocasia esculenta]|uniref:Uncharacterized protein n=1 Tax=Colocasia esculenta TaxID=4460 RepID=A0A843W7H1_COLES|nr:hypothetical protein [Colocasia esculenta]
MGVQVVMLRARHLRQGLRKVDEPRHRGACALGDDLQVGVDRMGHRPHGDDRPLGVGPRRVSAELRQEVLQYGLDQVDIVGFGVGGRREEQILHPRLVQLATRPSHELRLGGGRRPHEGGDPEQPQEETPRDGAVINGYHAHYGLEYAALPRQRLLSCGVRALWLLRLRRVREVFAGVDMEGFPDQRRGDLLCGADGGNDGPKVLQIELGDVLRPPVSGHRSMLLPGVTRSGVSVGPRNLDLVDDGFDAAVDDAEVLRPAHDLSGRLQRDDGVFPALQDAGLEEGLQLHDEVALGDRLGHPQELGGADGGDEVVGAEADGDAVGELGAELEGLLAAGDVMEGHRGGLHGGVLGVGAEALQKATLEKKRELQLAAVGGRLAA